MLVLDEVVLVLDEVVLVLNEVVLVLNEVVLVLNEVVLVLDQIRETLRSSTSTGETPEHEYHPKTPIKTVDPLLNAAPFDLG